MIDTIKKGELSKGRGFGEMALLYNAKRSKSIVATGICKFWAIDRVKFREVISKDIESEYDLKVSSIKKADIFGNNSNLFNFIKVF